MGYGTEGNPWGRHIGAWPIRAKMMTRSGWHWGRRLSIGTKPYFQIKAILINPLDMKDITLNALEENTSKYIYDVVLERDFLTKSHIKTMKEKTDAFDFVKTRMSLPQNK